MLVEPTIEELLPYVENRYTLAIAIAKRTRQLVDGAEPMVEETENPNLVTLACEEMAADKLAILPGELEPFIPLRPEVSAALAQASREDDDDDFMPINPVQTEEEPEPVPVSKIRVMDPNEIFYMPYELEDEEPEEDEDERTDEEDVDDEPADEAEVEAEVEDIDLDLDRLDSSIDEAFREDAEEDMDL